MSVVNQEVEKLINIGFTYHQDGCLDEAENAYQEVLAIDGKNAEVFNLLGVLKLQQNDVISAINWIEKAVEIKSDVYFYETLFQAYVRAGLFKQIVAREKEVLEKFPDNFSLLFNIALANKKTKNIKAAIKFYDKALKINPGSYLAWFNLSHLYSIEGETENALSALKICKKIRPNDIDTDYFLSLALMRTKNYDKGLKLFETRLCRETATALQNKTYPNKATKETLWKGENIKNKTIYVYYEAGFGDVIMFSRYLPLLANRCGKLLFLPQKQLVPLFRDNPLGIDVVIDKYIPECDMNFDVHAPLLSLPYLLGLKGDKVFAYPEGYIRPNKELAEEFKKKYFNNDKIKVGIKWQGNTYYDQDRVIPTKFFKPLMEVENTQYYSFQTFEGSEDAKELDGIIDVGKDLIDFGQTAAALSNLDIVICNDTSLAHLAGAMGIPCWVILPYEVNWRWHTDLSVCDWYNSVKLFRQHSIGNWQSVFDDILNEMIEA
ncbi:MAG: hypothetical protein BHW62_08560 [Acinetobacter sp. CAG:196_36_41]|nr:MAG: hypothetical protein BHW62_08560 [Acinetobacter sp. CAG:196_36_41]